jgi:hypothetical protein
MTHRAVNHFRSAGRRGCAKGGDHVVGVKF